MAEPQDETKNPARPKKSVWSFVDEETGEFIGRTFAGLERDLEANTPPGCRAVEGRLTRPRPPNPLRDIQDLEQGQFRALRELALDPSNAAARQRLAEIDNRISDLRGKLPRRRRTDS